MEELFPLSEREKWFKTEYMNGEDRLLKKPMTYWEYERISQEKKRYYIQVEQYHEELTANAPGNTIKDVGVSGDNIEVTLHARYSYPIMHNHEYIEMIYVYSGTCRHFVEEQSFLMHTGDVCILTPNAMHAISAEEDEAVIINIMMSKKMFNASFFYLLRGGKVLSDFFERIFYNKRVSPYIIFPTKDDTWMRRTVLEMYRERRKKDYLYNESETLYVKQIFIHLIRRYEMFAIVSNPANHSQENHIVGLMGYISVNYNHITLKEAAKFFGYNETYLGHMIQQYTGKTFSALITELQMNRAKTLLEESSMSVTEIGSEVGCYDSSHFIRKFKAAYGSSPSAYRKQKQAEK